MITALLIWLYKKYATNIFKSKILPSGSTPTQSSKAIILFLVLTWSFPSSAQELKLAYRIIHNGSVVGQMQFHRKVSGSDTYFNLTSHVKTRFVVPILIQTTDEAHFNNDKLLSSTVCRMVNGKKKESKKTLLLNNSYELQYGSKFHLIDKSISYNMMMLYCQEPSRATQIYSDNYQQFLPIKKLASHKYRIVLPDGNYNDYQFENGTCQRVTVHHDWYTVTMELV